MCQKDIHQNQSSRQSTTQNKQRIDKTYRSVHHHHRNTNQTLNLINDTDVVSRTSYIIESTRPALIVRNNNNGRLVHWKSHGNLDRTLCFFSICVALLMLLVWPQIEVFVPHHYYYCEISHNKTNITLSRDNFCLLQHQQHQEEPLILLANALTESTKQASQEHRKQSASRRLFSSKKQINDGKHIYPRITSSSTTGSATIVADPTANKQNVSVSTSVDSNDVDNKSSSNKPTTSSTSSSSSSSSSTAINRGQKSKLPEGLRKRIIQKFIKDGGDPQNVVISDSTITTTSQSKKKTITTVYKILPNDDHSSHQQSLSTTIAPFIDKQHLTPPTSSGGIHTMTNQLEKPPTITTPPTSKWPRTSTEEPKKKMRKIIITRTEKSPPISEDGNEDDDDEFKKWTRDNKNKNNNGDIFNFDTNHQAFKTPEDIQRKLNRAVMRNTERHPMNGRPFEPMGLSFNADPKSKPMNEAEFELELGGLKKGLHIPMSLSIEGGMDDDDENSDGPNHIMSPMISGIMPPSLIMSPPRMPMMVPMIPMVPKVKQKRMRRKKKKLRSYMNKNKDHLSNFSEFGAKPSTKLKGKNKGPNAVQLEKKVELKKKNKTIQSKQAPSVGSSPSSKTDNSDTDSGLNKKESSLKEEQQPDDKNKAGNNQDQSNSTEVSHESSSAKNDGPQLGGVHNHDDGSDKGRLAKAGTSRRNHKSLLEQNKLEEVKEESQDDNSDNLRQNDEKLEMKQDKPEKERLKKASTSGTTFNTQASHRQNKNSQHGGGDEIRNKKKAIATTPSAITSTSSTIAPDRKSDRVTQGNNQVQGGVSHMIPVVQIEASNDDKLRPVIKLTASSSSYLARQNSLGDSNGGAYTVSAVIDQRPLAPKRTSASSVRSSSIRSQGGFGQRKAVLSDGPRQSASTITNYSTSQQQVNQQTPNIMMLIDMNPGQPVPQSSAAQESVPRQSAPNYIGSAMMSNPIKLTTGFTPIYAITTQTQAIGSDGSLIRGNGWTPVTIREDSSDQSSHIAYDNNNNNNDQQNYRDDERKYQKRLSKESSSHQDMYNNNKAKKHHRIRHHKQSRDNLKPDPRKNLRSINRPPPPGPIPEESASQVDSEEQNQKEGMPSLMKEYNAYDDHLIGSQDYRFRDRPSRHHHGASNSNKVFSYPIDDQQENKYPQPLSSTIYDKEEPPLQGGESIMSYEDKGLGDEYEHRQPPPSRVSDIFNKMPTDQRLVYQSQLGQQDPDNNNNLNEVRLMSQASENNKNNNNNLLNEMLVFLNFSTSHDI